MLVPGTIHGTVTDPTSALVRGAKVEAKNQETGTAQNLDPGVYTVAATASGFNRTEQKDVALVPTVSYDGRTNGEYEELRTKVLVEWSESVKVIQSQSKSSKLGQTRSKTGE